MTVPEQKTNPAVERAELFLRLNRRGLIFVLVMTAAFGAFFIAQALWPDASWLRVVEGAPWLTPIAIIILVAVQQTMLRKHGLTMQAPELKAILSDEWRRQSMDRATRVSLVTVLIAQVPLALLISQLPAAHRPVGALLSHLPALRPALSMAVCTVTLGLIAQIALFLFFDRETGDGR